MPIYPIEPDSRVSLIVRDNDYSAYQQKLPDLYLKSNVHEVVKEHIRITKKILEHSYFVYEFIDVAFTQVIVGLEKALKIKYQEIENKNPNNRGLNGLVNWAHKQGMFELEHVRAIDVLMQIRNDKVHNAKNTLGGFAYLYKIMVPIGFINDLYEDVTLRKERFKMIKELKAHFAESFKDGAVLIMGEKNCLAAAVLPVFINNKAKDDMEYSISVVPLMKPEFVKSHHHIKTVNLRLREFKFLKEKNAITGVDQISGVKVMISKIDDDFSLRLMKSWNQEIDLIGDEGLIAKATIPFELDRFYQLILDDFYKVA